MNILPLPSRPGQREFSLFTTQGHKSFYSASQTIPVFNLYDCLSDNPSMERNTPLHGQRKAALLYILPVMPGPSSPVLPHAYLFITSRCPPSYIIASRSLALALSRRHRFGFIRCEVRPSRLIRRLEVHFLQNLPPAESIRQEKPSYEADKTAVCCICKTQKRFREKGAEEREKTNIQ